MLRSDREFRESERVEVMIQSFLVHQLLVGPDFRDAAFVKDDDAVGTLNGGEAVGDDKGRSSFHQLFKRLLHESLRLTVEGRGGFVEQQDFWIF